MIKKERIILIKIVLILNEMIGLKTICVQTKIYVGRGGDAQMMINGNK